MAPPILRHHFVHDQLHKFHEHLREIEHLGTVTSEGVRVEAETLRHVRHLVADALENERPPQADYYSRAPIVSIFQSALDRHLEHKRERAATNRDKTAHDQAEADRVEHDDERMGDPFTKWDIAGWVGDIALSLIGRVFEGSHDFCPIPAEAKLESPVRLVLISDWGTGRKEAAAVGLQAEQWAYARPGRAHVIHLGDNYYSGTKIEAQNNVLKPWPVGPGSSLHIGSWCLNGNHDMYSGGHGLFETILRDPRFVGQQLDGDRTTSWFHLQTDGWNILGLDTSWKNKILEVEDGRVYVEGALGHLAGDEQLAKLEECADDGRRLLVLSHHQLFSANDQDHALFGKGGGDTMTPLAQQVAPILEKRKVDAWFWGHEHDCLAYDEFQGVVAARAVGHGGVPVLVATSPAEPLGGTNPRFLVKPKWRDGDPEARKHVAWEYRDYRVGEDGRNWAKHGLAVLDLDGTNLRVSYVDDEGEIWKTEDL